MIDRLRRLVASDPLESLLVTRARAIADEAAANCGHVSDGSMAEIERLGRLVELRRKSLPPTRRRLTLALAGTIIVVVALWLNALHPRTAIELQLWGTEIGFTASSAQPVLDQFVTRRITVRGARALAVPTAAIALPVLEGESITLEGNPAGEITLERLAVDRGAAVTLAASAGERPSYAVTLAPVRGQLAASLDRAILARSGDRAIPLGFGVPARGEFARRSDTLELELDVEPTRGTPVLVPLSIGDLRLYRDEELPWDSARPEWHRRSTLDSAVIRFLALDRPRWTLAREDLLSITGLHNGTIHWVSMANHQVALRITGDVSDILVGASRRSIQPTLLESLRSRHDLTVIATAIASIFAFVLLLARHWSERA